MDKATVLSKLKGRRLGLYDHLHPKKKSLVASKAVDISAFCPNVRVQAVLMYSRDTLSPLVQLNNMETKNGDVGRCVCFHFAAMGEDNLKRDTQFIMIAHQWGIQPHELARLILENAPG